MSLRPSVERGEAEFPKLPSPGHLLPAKCWYSHTMCLLFQVISPHLFSLCSPNLFFSSQNWFFTSFPWILAGFAFSLCDEVCQAHSRRVSPMLSSNVFDTLPGSPFWPLHISTYICFMDHRQASSRAFYYTSAQVTLFFFNFSSNIQVYVNF